MKGLSHLSMNLLDTAWAHSTMCSTNQESHKMTRKQAVCLRPRAPRGRQGGVAGQQRQRLGRGQALLHQRLQQALQQRRQPLRHLPRRPGMSFT